MLTFKTNDAYGQPAVKDFLRDGGFGQDVEQKFLHPMIKTSDTGYGQERLLEKPTWIPKLNDAYGQQSQSGLNDLVSERSFSPSFQQSIVRPTFKTMSFGSGQQLDMSSIPLSQPTWSNQQTDFSRGNSAFMSSPRLISSSQPIKMSDSSSFSGW